jgi:acetylornithine deacetylase/succinyl-diaminopimelate desuccinylase-like protein
LTNRRQAVALLDRYLRIPTISRAVTAEMVEEVRALWRAVGLDLAPLAPPDGDGTPALHGEIPGPAGAPTLLIYGHYDVQPTGDLARWQWEGVACRPFVPAYFLDGRPTAPAGLDDEALDRVLVVARGGADNKGQHLAALLGVLAAARAGRLRWTVKVLLDGEEEHGSPSLPAIVRAHAARLRADLLVASDGPKQRDAPTLALGVRGLVVADLVAENGRPASLHSGNYGNIVPNPVLPLARLVADIEERVRAHAAAHDAFRRQATEVFARWGDRAVWRPFLWPTVNVNHFMTDGASPVQHRTIIPRSAHARVDVRLTPDTPPAAVIALIERAVAERQGQPEGITFVARTTGLPASYTSPERAEFRWLLRLLEETGGAAPVAVPILGGFLPAYVFTELLGLPAFWIPAANSDNQQHDVNEHYGLRHFSQQAALYGRIAASLPSLQDG